MWYYLCSYLAYYTQFMMTMSIHSFLVCMYVYPGVPLDKHIILNLSCFLLLKCSSLSISILSCVASISELRTPVILHVLNAHTSLILNVSKLFTKTIFWVMNISTGLIWSISKLLNLFLV